MMIFHSCISFLQVVACCKSTRKFGDLSRRLRLYTLQVMSLHEYIAVEKGIVLPTYTLDQILTNSINIASEVSEQLTIQPIFESYLNHGCYPFYKEEGDGFEQRLQETIWTVLERDWPYLWRKLIMQLSKRRSGYSWFLRRQCL